MIKAEVVFEDDFIILNGKNIWLDGDSMCYAVGDFNADLIVEMFASQEQAISYCLNKQNIKAHEGFILLPIDCTDEIAEAIAYNANCCGGIAYDIYQAIIQASKQYQ